MDIPNILERNTSMNKKTRLTIFFGLHVLILILLGFVLYYIEEVINISILKIKLWKNFLGFLFLIFGIYFFVLPDKFVVGGLESELIFLDKLFFYDKKKKIQKEILSNSNFIIVVRFFIIFIAGFKGWDFFILTMLVNGFFIINFKLLNYYRIPKDFFIKIFPSSIKKNNIYKFLLSSLIIGHTVGIGCSLIFNNKGNTGGSDVIIQCLSSIFTIEFSTLLMLIDGVMILWSCYLDLYRYSRKYNHQILIRYFFSIVAFLNVILFIKYIN